MITKIILSDELEENYFSKNSNNSFDNLNQLNIFIGENNTGKSRFLRTLFANRTFILEISDFDLRGISKVFESMAKELDISLGNLGYEDVSSQNILGLKSTLNNYIKKT